MPKKYLAGLFMLIATLGLAGYWFYWQQKTADLGIARLPPAQALGFFAVPGWPQGWADLQQSKFYQHVVSAAFWQRALGAEGYQHLMAEKHRLEQHLGRPLTEPTVNLLLGREFGLALVPGQERIVDVIAYVRVSGTEKIVESLTRTFAGAQQDVVRQTQTVDGFEIVTLRPKGVSTSVSYAFLGTLAVLSTDPAWVIDAVKARRGISLDRLYSTPTFQAMQLESTAALLAYGYYDGERLQAQTRGRLPGVVEMPSTATLQMLQTTGKVTLKATRAGDGIMAETMAWYPQAGAPQVFRQVERDGAILPFRGVPAETFYLTHVDLLNLQGVWQLLRQFAAVSDQQVFQQWLAEFRHRAGVDLEGDVIPVLTGVTGFGITAPFGATPGSPIALPGVFLTLGLTDEAKAQHLMQTVMAHAGGSLLESLQRQSHDGQMIYYLGHPLLFVSPGYVISHQQLILASDVSLLRHMLDAATGKTKTLADTTGYQDIRKHFRLQGGSMTFIDVSTSVERMQETWLRLGGLIRALTRLDTGAASIGSMPGDPWTLLEILRPIRYIGVASQAEAQGVRSEAFIAIQDLP
jgi:uncharacterized protein DUF3352